MHVLQTFPFLLARWVPMQAITIDPIFNTCTRYSFWLGGLRRCEYEVGLMLFNYHHWELNPRPSNLGSNALTTCFLSLSYLWQLHPQQVPPDVFFGNFFQSLQLVLIRRLRVWCQHICTPSITHTTLGLILCNMKVLFSWVWVLCCFANVI